MEADPKAIAAVSYALVRDYPVCPLSITPDRLTLAAVGDASDMIDPLEYLLCTSVQFEMVSTETLASLRLRHYGIGYACTQCPTCGSRDIASIIWNLMLDNDSRVGDPSYVLAENYTDGRGHVDQQVDDPRWQCRTCGTKWGWSQENMGESPTKGCSPISGRRGRRPNRIASTLTLGHR